MALNGRFASGLSFGIAPFFAMWLGVLLSLSRADVDAAFSDRGSTADSSTADGVWLIGKAVAVTPFAGKAAGVDGLLNISNKVDLCASLIGCLGVTMVGIRPGVGMLACCSSTRGGGGIEAA